MHHFAPCRIRKPEVFLLPKDAKKNASGERPGGAAWGCILPQQNAQGEGQCGWMGLSRGRLPHGRGCG